MDIGSLHDVWVAVQVRSRYEFTTAEFLRYKGYETFVPTYRSKRQWSDRSKELELPLFSGYIFCRFQDDVRGAILLTPGIIRIVGTRKEVARIDEREIQALKCVVASRVPAMPHPFLNVGDRVRIMDGPVAGVEGIFLRHKGGDRLILSVQLVQRSIELELQGAQFALVAPEPERAAA